MKATGLMLAIVSLIVLLARILNKRISALFASLLLIASCYYTAYGAETSMEKAGAARQEDNRNSTVLQARLDEAENNFKNGKLKEAIDQSTSLLDVSDSSFFHSDRIAQEAKADLAVFQFKAGRAELSAQLIAELLVRLQLDLHMDPRFDTEAPEVLASAPAILKEWFSKTLKRLHEDSPENKLIFASLINNTYPKDYKTQLSAYCKRLQHELDLLASFRSTADSEELKYIDPINLIGDDASETT